MNPRTVTRLAREGKIPAVKVGKRWRFKSDELSGWSSAGTGERAGLGDGTGRVGKMRVASLIREELVIADLASSDKEGALGEMVSRLVEAGELREADLFMNLLMEREDLMSTSIAAGVALPHPRRTVPGMFRRSLVSVAVSRGGVDFAGLDGVPVRLFFLICASDDRAHLRILSRLSELMRNTPIVERILGARFPAEIVKVISAQEESALEDIGTAAP